MCGIAGIFQLTAPLPVDESILSSMNQTQFHRGPDEGGLFVEPGIGLAHRRLSIIDLSNGQQPFITNDKQVALVYNGEIYNFRELREELVAKGYSFRTDCDTEVVAYAWKAWGTDCVTRFRGMFAFALWDRSSEQLFLARDRLGIKPLYYAELSSGEFLFGSELKAITAHPKFRREILPEAVEDYFAYGYVPEPKTIYRNTYKLEPGYTLMVDRQQRIGKPVQYWEVPFGQVTVADEAELQHELIERLTDAVKIRMVAEVPLGAFLSGGVDSSAIVAMMSNLSDSPVNTCSISFGDPKFNEASYAQSIADRYQTEHVVSQVDPDDYSLIDKLANLYDEPYADSSAMPTYRVCELAKKQVTVALSGDGGDENFAGYRRYRMHTHEEKIRSMLPLGVRQPLFGLMGQVYPKADWAPQIFRAKSTFESLARDTAAAFAHSVSVIGDPLRDRLFSASLKQQLHGYNAAEVMRGHLQNAPTDHPTSIAQYLDMKTWLPGDILTKVDRASMAHSLEVRVPILDHQFVEWTSTLSPDLKLRGSEGKYLLKKSLEPHLPHDILYRKKMGFSIPMASWFRGPLKERVREAVTGSVLQSTGFFDQKFLETLVDQHQSGRRDFSAPLWSLLMFESFYRQQIAGAESV